MAFDLPARPTQGCMACKAQQPYAVEHFTNRNTGGRCLVCGKILRLIPGTSSERHSGVSTREEPRYEHRDKGGIAPDAGLRSLDSGDGCRAHLWQRLQAPPGEGLEEERREA